MINMAPMSRSDRFIAGIVRWIFHLAAVVVLYPVSGLAVGVLYAGFAVALSALAVFFPLAFPFVGLWNVCAVIRGRSDQQLQEPFVWLTKPLAMLRAKNEQPKTDVQP
jgi:hypothetical protein